MTQRVCTLLVASLAAATHAALAAGSLRLEPLRFETQADAGQPSVALDPSGGFIVTWQERAPGRASLWFATLDRDGRERRRGRIAFGENWFVNWADFPSLAVLANGDWVTYYFEKKPGDSPHAYDVRVLRSTDRGETWSKPLTPHKDGTASEHGFMTLVPLQADRVLAVWLDGRHTAGAHGGRMTLRSAMLDRAGTLTEEHQLDDSTCDCCQTDAVRAGGRTLVAYRDRSADEIRDISVIDRTDRGTWSTPRPVHADGWKIEGCPVNGPAIAANGSRVLTIWPTQATGTAEVRYTIGSWKEQGVARTLASGAGTLGRVDAAPWGDGFLVTFIGDASGQSGLQLAHIDPTGRVLTRQTAASVASTRMSGNPRLASTGEQALLAWIEPESGKEGSTVAIALVRGERQR